MRRKNLIATRVKKKKLQIKDVKIKKIYTKFRSIIYKKIKRNSFALAVSGGSDSLCLAYFGKKYTKEFKNKMHVLIVDHKLRIDSKTEALKDIDKLKKESKNSDQSFEGALFASQLSANYAKNYEVYCK